jgi:hypothetical protein
MWLSWVSTSPTCQNKQNVNILTYSLLSGAILNHMTQPEMPEHFMTPRFFSNVQAAGGIAIRAELDQLAGMDEFIKINSGFGLPAAPNEIDFVYFWTAKGEEANPHFHKAVPSDRFMPASALQYENAFSVPKWEVEARRRTVVELQTHDLERPNPLSFAAARAMVAQTPEQAGILVGSQAWLDYARSRGNRFGVVDALINGFAPERYTRSNRLAEEAARRFSGAIVLERRGQIKGPGGRPQITEP